GTEAARLAARAGAGCSAHRRFGQSKFSARRAAVAGDRGGGAYHQSAHPPRRRIRGAHQRTPGRAAGRVRSLFRRAARADHRFCGTAAAACDLSVPRICYGRRTAELRRKHYRCLSSVRRLYRADSQGGKALGAPSVAADQVRNGDQFKDRKSARHQNLRQSALARRRGDRVMRRREFITLLGGAAIAWPIAARAQQPSMPVVGFLRSTSSADSRNLVVAFRQGLREAGFVEGQDYAIEYRWADNQLDRLPSLVADLLRRPVAVIVGNTPSALAAKAATKTVPIVFATGGNPVREGLVASLNRPGGNVTGVSFISVELGAKRLGLLRELRPGAARIAVFVDPKFPTTERFISEVRDAASAMGQQIEVLYVGSDREIESAFTTLVQRGAGALLCGSGGVFFFPPGLLLLPRAPPSTP